MTYQNLSRFRVPAGFRGRNALWVQLWWLVQACLFAWSPQFAYKWRNWLLRLFGAKIGTGVIIRPTVKITYPWKLTVGDYAWVGDDVELYTLGEINIGASAVVSQKCYLCTGSHDFQVETFDIYAKPIVIEAEAWLATDVFVAPGITIGRGALVGARSSVFEDMPSGMICLGYPAKPVKKRQVTGQSTT
ncbi:putative colanic acid biosynthesis acetyltransferase [Alteromonas sp. M12]|uniref:putative colanic acid biosynthesis acetyltransferase n=1 Tax=Alteromonas sp. M12 TaxID=3135644 RepID=UPI00319EBBD1